MGKAGGTIGLARGVVAVIASLMFSVSVAAADRLPTLDQANRNLKIAQKLMDRAVVAMTAQLTPAQKEALQADQEAWSKSAEAGCAPYSDGSANAGSAAVREDTIEAQCMASATRDRTKRIREDMAR